MPEFNDPILGKIRYTVTREIAAICPNCDNPDCAEIEAFKQRVMNAAFDYDGMTEPDNYEYFKLQDLNDWPSRILLVEANYLREMFDLERVNEKDKPIVITLREKQEHFEARP